MEDDLTIANQGTLNAPALINVAGDVSVLTGGTFNANGGSIVLNGADQAINGDITFYNFTKEVASAATVTFEQSKQVTVTNNAMLKGADNELLELVSSAPGSTWLIAATGSKDIDYVSVTDSTNTDTEAIDAYHSYNGGNNTNWNFIDPNPEQPDDDDDVPTETSTDSGTGTDNDITYDTLNVTSTEKTDKKQTDNQTDEEEAIDDGQADYGAARQDEPAVKKQNSTFTLPKIGFGIAIGGCMLWLIVFVVRKLFPIPPMSG